MRTNRRFKLLVVATFFTTVAACSGSVEQPQEAEQPEAAGDIQEWRHLLGSQISVGPAYIWAAVGIDAFAEEGLDLKVISSIGAAQAVQVMAAGDIESETPAPPALIAAADRGEELPLVAVYNLVPQLHYWPVVKPSSSIQKPEDLKGATIGVSSAASDAVKYIKGYVEDYGLDPESDIEILAVGQDVQAARALYSGQVDALALWDVSYSLMEARDFDLRALPQSPSADELIGNIIVVHQNLIEESPDLIKKFLRAVAKSSVFTIANPEAAACAHYAKYPESMPTDQSARESVRQGAEILAARVPQLEPDSEMTHGEFDGSGWEAWADFMDVDLPSDVTFYTDEFIEYANDFDVAEVQAAAKEFDCPLF